MWRYAHGMRRGWAMSEVGVTDLGEIVARCIEGEVWTEPHPAGHVWLHVEGEANARIVASALVSRVRLTAWCRRVLREVDPDPVPTVDEDAIRADERAKCAEGLRAKAAEVVAMRDAAWSGAARRALRNQAEGYADAARLVERAGKHRGTP